jgi:hypothetical protein
MTKITTSNTKECPATSFSDLLASKLSHTDVVSSDIQYAIKSIFGNSTATEIVSQLTSNHEESNTPIFTGQEKESEVYISTNLNWASLKVNNDENAKVALEIHLDKNESKSRCIVGLIADDFIYSMTKDILGQGLTLNAISCFSAELDGNEVDKVSYSFPISTLGTLNAERLIEDFFTKNGIKNINNNLLFENIYDGVFRNSPHIIPNLSIWYNEDKECTTTGAIIKDLGAYKSIKSKEPDLTDDAIFSRIITALVSLCEEIVNSVNVPSKKDAYPIFMRRMLMSQFKY